MDNGIASNWYGDTPALTVDSSGDILLVGNTWSGVSDFPETIPTTNNDYGFVAKIAPVNNGLVLAPQTTVTFSSQPVGVSTAVYGGTATLKLANYSSTAATLTQPIQVSPGSIFSESDNCGTSIAAGSFCSLNINFTPLPQALAAVP